MMISARVVVFLRTAAAVPYFHTIHGDCFDK
jgi:hypothetical protein